MCAFIIRRSTKPGIALIESLKKITLLLSRMFSSKKTIVFYRKTK